VEDKKIIEQLWARLESALSALAEKYGKRLLCTAQNILGNIQDAEEAVNDTYLALWNAIPPEQPDPLGAYVCRIGKNIALKQLRGATAQKRDNRYDLSLDELSDILPGDQPEDTLNARVLGQAIDRFLAGLPRESRILFVRRYWFGDAVKDIARDLNLSESAASVRLHRLRARLKDYLYKEGIFL